MSASPSLGGGNPSLPATQQQQQQQHYIPYLGAPHVVPVATPYAPALTGGGSNDGNSFSSFPFQLPPSQQRHDSFSGTSATNASIPVPSSSQNQITSPVQAVVAGLHGTKSANNKRAIQSCAECKIGRILSISVVLWLIGYDFWRFHRRKIKCNRVIPCGPCILRGEEATCKEVEKIEPVHMPVPTMMDFEAAVSRIQELEDSVAQLHRLMNEHRTALLNMPQATSIAAPDTASQVLAGLREPFPLASAGAGRASKSTAVSGLLGKNVQEREHEDMAMILEDFAMNNRANRDRAVQRLGAAGTANNSDDEMGSTDAVASARLSNGGTNDHGASAIPIGPPSRSSGLAHLLAAQQTANGHTAEEGTPFGSLDPSHPLHGIAASGVDYVSRFLSQGPDATRAWQLIQFYITHLEWYSRVLHTPTFAEECKAFLALPQQSNSRARPTFLATYFVVLCIALQYIGEQEKADLGYTTEQAQTMCLSMFSAAQAMLNLSDYMAVHTLENLQVILLMGVYQYNVGQADSHWSLLGTAIKIAQNIGLSRLGAERDDIRWPERWRDPLKREIGRRVWWNLIFLDWSHAIAHNACYSIHPSQNFTDFPSNVDDADLREDQPVIGRPADQYSESSFTICKLRFVTLYRELADHQIANSPPLYPFILEMDTRIVRTLDTLPIFFRSPPATETLNDARIMECLLIQLIGESRLLRLHRPYLTRGYRERTYAPSKDRCVHSARSILVLLKTAEKVSPILLGTWLVLFYGFGAAVVTFIDLCHGKLSGDDSACRQKRQQIRDMIVLLQGAKNMSDAARGATTLLEGLLAAEEDMSRQPKEMPSNKRKSDAIDDGDPFKRVVKKLLLSSTHSQRPQVGEGSPSASSTSASQVSPAVQFSALVPLHNGTQGALPAATSPGKYAASASAFTSTHPNVSAGPLHAPPFQPDLDLFLEGAKSYAQLNSDVQVPTGNLTDPTSMDLSYLFTDDMLSNLFADDPLLGLQNNGNGLGGGW